MTQSSLSVFEIYGHHLKIENLINYDSLSQMWKSKNTEKLIENTCVFLEKMSDRYLDKKDPSSKILKVQQDYRFEVISHEQLKKKRSVKMLQSADGSSLGQLHPIQATIILAVESIARLVLQNSCDQDAEKTTLPIHDRKNRLISDRRQLGIPPEILATIFSFTFKSWKEVRGLASVSKQFYEVFTNPLMFSHVFSSISSEILSECPSLHLSCSIMQATQYFPTVFGAAQKKLTDKDLEVLGMNSIHLKQLILNEGAFSLKSFSVFLKKCPQLKTIEFIKCDLEDFDDFITSICVNAPQVEALKIIDSPLTNCALFTLAMYKTPIKSFEFWNSLAAGVLTDEGLGPFLYSMTKLESLKITGCQKVIGVCLKYMINPNLIKELTYSYCSGSSPEIFECLMDRFGQLESLELDFIPSTAKDEDKTNISLFLDAIITDNPCLRVFRMGGCDQLTTSHLVKLIKNSPLLSKLEIIKCLNLNKDVNKIKYVSESLKIFSFEPLSSMVEGDNANLLSLLEKFNSLTTISLLGCSFPAEAFAKYLNNVKNPQLLTSITLRNSTLCVKQAIEIFAKKYRHLELLELDVYTQSLNPIENETLRLLGKSCRHLRCLQLSINEPVKPELRNNQSREGFSSNTMKIISSEFQNIEQLYLKPMKPSSELGMVCQQVEKKCIHLTHCDIII